MDNFVERAGKKGNEIDIEESEYQDILTEKYVKPIINDLFELTINIRKRVDIKFINEKKVNKEHINENVGKIDIEYYPIGYCNEIRNDVFDKLKENEIIKNLVKEGVLFKKVYVLLNKKYTQNAMQLGSIFLDVANDSVSIVEPVVFTDIKNLNYKNLNNYDDYFKIVENYLNVKFYPNIYLKEIAEIFPMIALDANGVCSLFLHQEVILYKDIALNFKLAKEFQEDNSFEDRILPYEYIRMLEGLKSDAKDNEFGTPKTLLEKYYKADDELRLDFFSSFLEDEIRRLIDDLCLKFHFIQMSNRPPINKVKEMQILGILPRTKLKT